METDEKNQLTSLSTKPENRATYTRVGQFSSSTVKIFVVDPQITYHKVIGKGKLECLAGTTIQQNKNDGQSINAYGFVTDEQIKDIKSAASFIVNSTIASVYKYNAIYGRLNYNLKDKYIVSLNTRRDGSSRFGPESRFHGFYSTGLAWLFSEENIIKNNFKWLSFGKVKASYGTSGNDQIGDYTYMNLYAPTTPQNPYQGSGNVSIAVTAIPNPRLQWEETKKLSVGLDLGFLKDRVLLTANYGRNRSSNELVPYGLPTIAGFTQVYVNFPATVQNTSYEFTMSTINLVGKKIKWTSIFNLTCLRNKLLSFPGLATSSSASSLVIGQPINIIKVFHFLGVDPATGIYSFADSRGKTTLNPVFSTDRTVLINTMPEFDGGLQNNFTYGNFQLDVLFQFVKQPHANSSNVFGISLPPGYVATNQPVGIIDRWQKPGDQALIQRYNSNFGLYSQWSNAISSSDASYIDASYIRLKSMSIS